MKSDPQPFGGTGGERNRTGMRNEYREMAHRPQAEYRKQKAAPLSVYFDFIRDYLLPYKALLIACIALVSLNPCHLAGAARPPDAGHVRHAARA